MIWDFLRIRLKFAHKPLNILTIYKAVLFTLWVMLFDIIETYIHAYIKTPDPAKAFNEIKHPINLDWLGPAVE
jgi:hypothetical protein